MTTTQNVTANKPIDATIIINNNSKRRPNIIMILVDDLGYGDLSVSPFTGHGIKTPKLEQMAQHSTILTNFHVTAPICTPSRASILTGLFPWRLGIYSIYGSGPQADEHLAVIPNVPMAFLAAGYHTAHVGKWHLGGLKPNDLLQRRRMAKSGGSNNCQGPDPGPAQHGFAEYVAMEEGPGSVRLTSLLPESKLYHNGAQHLVRNDSPYPPTSSAPASSLTDRQTDEAIRIMNETITRNQQFYLHLWYDAPHGPWEVMSPFDKLYKETQWDGGRTSRNFKYATMVSSVDANIGRIRKAIKDLGIARDTLIVFLSDNGPEERAGSAGLFKGRKRSLNEGGIRVPCMYEWPGHISENKRINIFSLSTDIFPTVLAAAGVSKPAEYRLDGTNILDNLLVPASSGLSTMRASSSNDILHQRVAYWHKDIDGKASAVWWRGYKLLIHGASSANSGSGTRMEKMTIGTREIFDMTVDERENRPIKDAGHVATVGIKNALHGHVGRNGTSDSGGDTDKASISARGARNDARHLSRTIQHLDEKLSHFVEHGNRLYAEHKARETRQCSAPLPSECASFKWELQKVALPEY